MSTRPGSSLPTTSPHQPEVSPRRISRRDKDLDLPSPVAEEPTSDAAATKSTQEAKESPVTGSGNAVQQPDPIPAGALLATPADYQYRGSSDDSDEEMADEEEQDASGTDESEISLQDTPKVRAQD